MRGSKQYELTDHLGNVRTTFSDIKEPNTTADTPKPGNYTAAGNPDVVVAYNKLTDNDNFKAPTLTLNNYYPYGMLQAERSRNAGGYRFGFNGMEQTKGVQGDGAGTFYDYKNRDYDPWNIRFKRTDALESKYPFYSPYQFAGNSPILYIDIDGLEPSISPSNSELWRKDIKNLRENKDGSLSYTVQSWQIYQKEVENMNILYKYLDDKNGCEWKEFYHTGKAANERAQSMIGFSNFMSETVFNTGLLFPGFGEIGLLGSVITRPTFVGGLRLVGSTFTKGAVSGAAQYWTSNGEVDRIDVLADAILPMGSGVAVSSAFNWKYNFGEGKGMGFQSVFSSGKNNISMTEFYGSYTNGLLYGHIGEGMQWFQKYVYMTDFKITEEALESSGVGMLGHRAHLALREHGLQLFLSTISSTHGIDKLGTKK